MNSMVNIHRYGLLRKRILPIMLTIAFLLYGFAFIEPVRADDEESLIPNLEYKLTDTKGNTVSTANNGSKVKILIFGRVGCGNCRATLSSISSSSWISEPGIEVMFIEEGYAADDELNSFIEDYCCDQMTICPASGGDGNYIMWKYYHYYYGYSSVTFPVIFYIDENNNIRDMTTNYQTESQIIRRCAKFCDFGDADYVQYPEEMKVLAACGQTEARSMLDEINARRTGSNGNTPWCYNSDNEKIDYSGLGELTYDYGLENAAMQRAAELALLYSHERPSGEPCTTAIEISETYLGENIAMGFTSAESVLDAWWEEDEDYNGQGHRRNILNSGFNYIGIGHVCVNGVDYWTQELSKTGSDAAYTEANDSMSSFNVTFYRGDIRYDDMYSDMDEINIKPGDTVKLPDFYEIVYHDKSYYSNGAEVENSSEWVIKDPSVAVITGKLIVGKSVGETELIREASYGGDPLVISISVRNEAEYDPYEQEDPYDSYDPVDSGATDGNKEDEDCPCNEEDPQDGNGGSDGQTPDDTQPVHQHVFGDWITIIDAAETAPGEQLRACSDCGYAEVQEIAQLLPTLKAVKISKPKAAKKSGLVKWKKVSKKNLKSIKKIEIQYSLDKSFKTGVKTKYAKANKTSCKIKKLKSKKKYYVRIRAYTYSGGEEHVSKWSAVKSFKAK